MKLFASLSLLLWASQAQAKAVFAHFMVGNVAGWGAASWDADILQAQEAGIDAFALNIAYGDDTIQASLATAFAAAASNNFKLFFSFDYAGGTGPWPEAEVISYLNIYSGNSAYYTYNGLPFVSTFEGPASSADWITVKSAVSIFFVPDWSSLGAKAAMDAAPGTTDGLFSWAAWPWGDLEMNTYTDASYYDYLGGDAYMMAVSPWFYTNLPGYDKNWLWRCDNLWYDRWTEIMYLQPEFVEIISWNDYGESHYIGPLYLDLLDGIIGKSTGNAPFDYLTGMSHDGWRKQLPFLIDTYKNNISTIETENIVAWFRPQPVSACSDGGTSANTHVELQIEFAPADVLEDNVFFSALLGSTADVIVTVGGASVAGTWTHTPAGGAGLYYGSVAFPGTGDVVVTITRSGSTVVSASGGTISTECTDGYENFNAQVISASSSTEINVTPRYRIEDMVCVKGTGAGNFAGLCEFTCALGYCPVGACYCTDMGPQATLPKATGVTGYPIAGEGASYSGLCSFACNYGYCPDTACGTVEVTLVIPTVSPFLPNACTAGTYLDNADLIGLCSYSCNYGMCPRDVCTCTGEGALIDAPATTASGTFYNTVVLGDVSLDDLCQFACARGYCPDTCSEVSSFEETNYCSPILVLDDGAAIWSKSLAEVTLQAYIQTRGTTKNIDSGIALAFNFDETSNCASIDDSVDCPIPTLCPSDEDEVPYFFIYQAFSHFHTFLNELSTTILSSSYRSSLDVASLVTTFTLPTETETSSLSDFLAGFGSALGGVSAGLGLVSPEGSAAAGVLSGIVSVASGLVPSGDSTADFLSNMTGVFDERIEIVFDLYSNALTTAAEQVFTTGTLTSFPDSALAYNTSNPDNDGISYALSKFFADGKYSMPVDADTYTDIKTQLTAFFRWNLINYILSAANVYILQDPFSSDDCEDFNGQNMLVAGESDIHCYTIEMAGVGNVADRGSGERGTYSNSLTADQIDAFSAYGLTFLDVVTGSLQCQKSTGGYGGMGDYSIPSANSIPDCIFNIPVLTVLPEGLDSTFYTDSTPCYLQKGYTASDSAAEVGVNYLPDYLSSVFSTAFCSTASSPSSGGGPGVAKRQSTWVA